MFLDKLSGRFGQCQYLLVVLTPALFRSKMCLAEISEAMNAHVNVIPILFEGVGEVEESSMWTMITRTSRFEEKAWLPAVQWFRSKNSEPAPPETAYSQPTSVSTLIRDKITPRLASEKKIRKEATFDHSDAMLSGGGSPEPDAMRSCHLAAFFEPPTGSKHIWFTGLAHYQRGIADKVQHIQSLAPGSKFNPAIDFWSPDDADKFLADSKASRTSCVLWRAAAPPVTRPSARASANYDDSAMELKLCWPVLASIVAEQGSMLDVVVVVMNRGAEYIANLPELTDVVATNIIWVALGDLPKRRESKLIGMMFDFFLSLFQTPGRVDSARFKAVYKKMILDQFPDLVATGIVQSSAGVTFDRYPFAPGRLPIRDMISDDSPRKLDRLKHGDSEFDPDSTVDIAHFHSAEALYKLMNKKLKNAWEPVVIGVMADWEDSGEGHGAAEPTCAAIQHACLKMCSDRGAVAKAIVRQDVAAGGTEAALVAAMREAVTVEPQTLGKEKKMPTWTKQLLAEEKAHRGSNPVQANQDPIVIWLQPRDDAGNLVDVPLSVARQMLKRASGVGNDGGGVASGGGRRRRKKGGASSSFETNQYSRWVFVVPVKRAVMPAATETFVVHSIVAPPSNILMDQACGDLLRLTNVPAKWLDGLTELALAMVIKSAVQETSSTELDHRGDGGGKDWVERVFRDSANSVVVRVRVTDIVFMHVLRSCMFRTSLIERIRAKLLARWRWHRPDATQAMSGVVDMALAEELRIDKQLFAKQYMAVLQQLDKLTAHQRKILAACFGKGNATVHLQGPAGSGKTFVALQVALKALDRESEEGEDGEVTKRKMLFVAPSPAMCIFFGRWLLNRFDKLYQDAADLLAEEYQIDIAHFNKGAADATGGHVMQRLDFQGDEVALEPYPTGDAHTYDLVVVDEAHHVFHSTVTPKESLEQLDVWMQECLRARAERLAGVEDTVPSVVLCSDLAQFGALSDDEIDFPDVDSTVKLEEVVRNSSRIVVASQAFSKTADLKLSSYTQIEGPPLRPYIVPSVSPDEDKFSLYAKYVNQAIADLHIDFGKMPLHRCCAILVPSPAFRDALRAELGDVFNVTAGDDTVAIQLVSAVEGANPSTNATLPEGAPQQVVLDTVESFDGMERLVILAVGLDTPRTDEGTVVTACSMIYRAMTRSHLFVAVVQQHVPGGWLEFLAAVSHVDTDPVVSISAGVTSTDPAATGKKVSRSSTGGDQQAAHVKKQKEGLQNQLNAITRVATDAARLETGKAAKLIKPKAIDTSIWVTNIAAGSGTIRVAADFFNPFATEGSLKMRVSASNVERAADVDGGGTTGFIIDFEVPRFSFHRAVL